MQPHVILDDSPGFILTDLTRKLWSDPTMQAWADANTPLGRLGEVEDLVGTAIFLASPAAAFLTGQYPLTNDVFVNDVRLPTDRPTLGTCLRDAGYRTGYIGKWHVDGKPTDPLQWLKPRTQRFP